MGYYIGSDSLGTSGLYIGLFTDHGNLKDWYMASAPSFFPDIFFYFLLLALCKGHFLAALMVYGFIQVVVLNALLSYVYKKTAPPGYQKFVWLIPLFISLYLMEGFWFSRDLMFGYYLTAHCYHLGPFINTLLLLAVFLSTWSKGLKYSVMLLLSAVGMLSDKLFVVMFYAPFLLALICSAKKENLKHTVAVFICLVAGAGLGLAAYEFLSQQKIITFLPPHRIYDLANAIPSLYMFINQMLRYLMIPGFRSLQIAFTFFTMIAGCVFYVKQRKKAETGLLFFPRFYIFFCLCVFFAPIVNGNYTGEDTLRYSVTPFFLASVVFALCIAFIFTEKLKARTTLVRPTLALILLMLVLNFSVKGFKEYIDYYPADVSEIDEAARKHHLTKGISEYWTAKKTTLLSKQHVKLLSVHANGCLSELGNNITSFYKGNFDFVVANDLMPAVMDTLFRIRDTVKTEHYTILVVDKFIYPEGKYVPETVVK